MGNRKTVGVVVSGIMDEFIIHLCKGIFGEAQKDDVNIVVIPVKYIDREMKNIPDLYEYQYKTNVQSVTSDNIDVLIVVADCIGCLTTELNLRRFMEDLRAKDIPIVLAASNIDDYPGVVFDNTAGIIDGITYLVNDLGIRRICMLTSHEHNADVAERYATFKEMMDYYRLELRPENVVKTNLSSDCRDDCEKLLDMNPDVEAIICANDDIAMGLYGVMKDRGLIPGKDIKVMGFDNSISGSMITPSLTTVDANAEHLGRRVYIMVRTLLDGWDVGKTTIPTRFILRDSFGSILDQNYAYQRILDKDYLNEYFHRVFYKFENMSQKEDFEILLMFKSLMNVIIDYVNDQVYNPERVSFLKSKVNEFFRTKALNYTDAEVLLTYVDSVKIAALHRFRSYERKCQAHETFAAIMEKIIKSLEQSIADYKNAMDSSLSTLKNMVEDTLDFNKGDDESYTNIVANLANFGVKNAYVYIYDTPVSHRNREDFKAPETVLLKVAMTDGAITIVPKEEQVIALEDIYDNEYITEDKFNMVQMPLYFREAIYGLIVYDLTEITYRNGDFLAHQYATAARVINILNQNEPDIR